MNSLSVLCHNETKDKYIGTIELILSASRQIREEVASIEVDILTENSMAELLEKSRPQMENGVRELQLAAIKASGKHIGSALRI